jgi:[acyl-carrier-protein] S-malonyltransferase
MSERKRALVICPGRGSYDRKAMGQLQNRSPQAQAIIETCDQFRQAAGRPTVSDLDAAERYQTTRHVAGEHASLLTFACSMADFAEINREKYDIVGVMGNSMGFYTALAASEALSLSDGIRLVDTMGAYQEKNVIGGQVLTPVCATDWSEDPDRIAAIDDVLLRLREQGHQAHWSIQLGGFAVLGADSAGVKALLKALPQEERGPRKFPLQLPLHSAFHTPLMTDTSARAFQDLADLRFQAPAVPLVDGRGWVFRPHASAPEDLADYTLGHQVTEPYDFTASLRTALRYLGPEVVILLGPGNSLGGPSARILVWEGWSGWRDRSAFDEAQHEDPFLLSFGVSLQRRLLA